MNIVFFFNIFVFSLRREYPPLSMNSLQMMIDTNRLDATKPIDLTALNNTGLLQCNPIKKHYGIQLTDEVLLSDI